jgi:hypothetical protein
MRWAQRLKRVFGIDIETCIACGGTMRIIACIEYPAVIEAILANLAGKARPVHAPRLPPGRAPPASAFSQSAARSVYRINRVYPDAVGSMPEQGIGWADGCPRWQCGGDEGAIRGDRREVARISAARPVVPAHSLAGTGLLKG